MTAPFNPTSTSGGIEIEGNVVFVHGGKNDIALNSTNGRTLSGLRVFPNTFSADRRLPGCCHRHR